jgi:hypothetical protein
MSEESPEKQLARFISRYDPKVARVGKSALRKMRALVPGATELVYDNYNALVVAFGPSERAADAIFSIAFYPRWVNLFFAQGAKLPDPHHLLKGSGKTFRNITLEDAGDLDDANVRALITTALRRAAKSVDPSARRRLVIKAVSPKQRPRRPRAR